MSSIWVARGLADEATIRVIADPDVLLSLSRCEIVKDQMKIKVGRVDLEIGGQVAGVYLKRYNAFSWRYRLGSFFLLSGALRSLRGAVLLKRSGFSTGRPIAAVEHRSWGMLTKSFYLSEEIPEAETTDSYWRKHVLPVQGIEGIRRRRLFLKRLAKLFRSLHAKNLYHNDLKDANILVSFHRDKEEESLYLLDLEGIRQCGSLSRRRRVKNLVQLNRTVGRLLRTSDKLYWLKVYLGLLFRERRERRRWVREIVLESNRRDERSARRR